jgi:hypothetical protein
MTVTSETDAPKTYELEVWRKQTDSETLTLSHVVKPETETDVGSLSTQHPGQPTVSVSYAQATDRFYETGSSKQFFGGLTTQELLGEWDKYDFRLLGEKDADGASAYELEGTLKPKIDSPIFKMVPLIRKETFMPAWVRLFDSRGDEIRTYHILEYRLIEGRTVIWRTEIINNVRKTKVMIELLSQSYPTSLDDNILTRENLKRLVRK